MANKILNTKKICKIVFIIYAVFFAAGIVFTAILGPKLDINFSGGTRISYSYKGDLKESDFEKTVKDTIKKDFTLSKNEALSGDTKTIVITLSGKNALDNKTQSALNDAVTEKYKDNSVELYDSTAVSPSVAGNFMAKSIFTIFLTAVFVTIYVAIRFKKIGGVSAALTAFIALIFDLLTSFFTCVIFRLPIDSNYIAVVLTILGYSLNDTIVVYDRVREKKKYNADLSVRDNMDQTIAEVLKRNIVTTLTTVCAVLTIVAVSEFCGLTIKDIDFEHNVVTIDHQLQRMSNMELIIEPTKTRAGTRKLPITEDVAMMFRAIIEDRPKPKIEKMVCGYSGFLYLDKNDLPEVALHWEHRFRHMVNRYNEIYRVQMPKITPHVCRHTYCSNMAKAGMNPKTLQYLMGHSDIGVTMNTYTHLGLEDAQDEMIRMEELNAARAEVAKTTGEKPVTQKQFRVV